jgi:glycerophosphoryl diester phosphodiesterase
MQGLFWTNLVRRRGVAGLIGAVLCMLLVVTPALAARPGNKEIAAHAGDREAKPASWKEDEWENSIQAVRLAFDRGVRWVEVDLQLNRHPEAITSSTPHGILYLHHNSTCEVIDSNGRGTGTFYNIGTDRPSLVDRCAERVSNMFNTFGNPQRWYMEMKENTGFRTQLPKAIYHLLKQRGWRTSVIVSSLQEDMLMNLRDEAALDGVTMNLMRVYGATTKPTNAMVDRARSLGFKYVNANVNDWSQTVVDYAKDRGMYVAGWHWILTSCTSGNERANTLGLDIMVTDCIGDLQARGWF